MNIPNRLNSNPSDFTLPYKRKLRAGESKVVASRFALPKQND